MVNENLRKRIIDRAIKKLAVKPLSILEAVTLQEYIEELEAAQQSVQLEAAGVESDGEKENSHANNN